MYTIGLCISDSKAKYGIVNRDGNIIGNNTISTSEINNPEDFVDVVSDKILKLLKFSIGDNYKYKISSMGIGAPTGNSRTGSMECSANVGWAKNLRVPLCEMFRDKLEIPVAIDNDAKAAALGEIRFGIAKDMKEFVYLTLESVGVGSAVISNGQLLRGNDGLAGELGHLRIVPNGRQCGCGRKGCLETYCSENGIIQTANELLKCSDKPSLLRNKDDINLLQILKAARNGDDVAIEVFERTGRYLGEACAEIATFCSPEAFIFYGGLSYAADFVLTPARQAYYENVLSLYRGHSRFRISNLREKDIPVLGAAAVGMEKYDDDDDDILYGY